MHRGWLVASLLCLAFLPSGRVQGEVTQPSGPSWPSGITGIYHGRLTGGEPVTTALFLDRTGELSGTYEFGFGGSLHPGQLSECLTAISRQARCLWTDMAGTGTLELTFAEDLESFLGIWTTDGSPQRHAWTGAKSRDGSAGDASEALEGEMPDMSGMMASFLDGMLDKLAEPEAANRLAIFVKNYYDALLARGFTKDEALRIITAVTIPSVGSM